MVPSTTKPHWTVETGFQLQMHEILMALKGSSLYCYLCDTKPPLGWLDNQFVAFNRALSQREIWLSITFLYQSSRRLGYTIVSHYIALIHMFYLTMSTMLLLWLPGKCGLQWKPWGTHEQHWPNKKNMPSWLNHEQWWTSKTRNFYHKNGMYRKCLARNSILT